MKILDAGHTYELTVYDSDDDDKSVLRFLKREGDNFPFNSGFYPGTNCQEVLRALIDRSEYLQKQKPCAETESIIALLKTALMLFETRAARIHEIDLSLTDLNQCVRMVACSNCGHVVCDCGKVQADYEFWSGEKHEI